MSRTNVSIPGIGYVNPQIFNNCTLNTCPITWSFYNYRVDLAANIVFAALFGIALLLYCGVWIWTRRAHFFNLVMTAGLIIEVIGYAGRAWSYYDQWGETAYLIQIICLTLAPAFFSAGVYVCLQPIVMIYGTENSIFQPRTYIRIFIPCDIISLILQGVGGSLAASALTSYSFEDFDIGTDIMTAGLGWQVLTLLCFIILCATFAFRVRARVRSLGPDAMCQEQWALTARKSAMFKIFLPALTLATILIFWRCIYRVVELNGGFYGPVTFDQGLFIGFEGVIILVAVYIMLIAHPAICMPDAFSKRY